MSTNILDTLKGYMTPDVMAKAASMFGESESNIGKAVGAISPSLLAGLLNKASDTGAMGSLYGMLTDKLVSDPSLLANVGGLLTTSSSSPLGMLGDKFLGGLFGTKKSGLAEMIAGVSGVKSSTVSSLLNFATPLIMGVLAKQITSGNLTMASLGNWLGGHRAGIINAAPAGLSGLLGLSSLQNLGSSIGGAAKTVTHEAERAKNKWLGPLLGLLLALLLIWLFARDCGAPKVEIPTIDSVAVRAQLDSIAAAAKRASESVKSFVTNKDLGGWIERTVGDVTLRIPEFGIEANLLGFITDASKVVDKTTWFDFDRLLFETGRATLKPESREQLRNVAEILKAYPETKVKIGGYTDNTGNPDTNLRLSNERATTVVTELVALGISPDRLTSEGYGEQHPVADNSTEEGRAKNRRIALRVTEK